MSGSVIQPDSVEQISSTSETPAPRATCPPLFRILLVLAAAAVGFAIQWHDGEYTRGAILLIGIAIVCVAFAVASDGGFVLRGKLQGQYAAILFITACLILLSQFLTLFIAWPGQDLHRDSVRSLLAFHFGLGCAAIAVATAIFAKGDRLRSASLVAVLCVFLFLGIGMVHTSPNPHIDVWIFERDAARALLNGHNPYAITFPDIYHSTLPGYPQQVYGPGLVVNDRCQFGYPYPPVTLLLTTLGYWVTGEPRYAQVVSLVIAGLFIGFTGRGRIAIVAAALLLFTPRIFFILGRAWTEPFAVMLLAATIFCAIRKSRWLPVALGLFLATKQYLILAVPLTFFLLPPGWKWRDWIALLVKAAIVAAVVTLPFALWNFPAFWKSTVTAQQMAPFRWDALSFIVWWGFHGHGDQVKLPNYAILPAAIASLIALAIALRRSPRTPAGFAASLALIGLAFFAFNKQAFCNYYFFVIGAICCAIAASTCSPRPTNHAAA